MTATDDPSFGLDAIDPDPTSASAINAVYPHSRLRVPVERGACASPTRRTVRREWSSSHRLEKTILEVP